LRGLIALREEGWREIQRRERVSIKVVPLDKIAGRTAENGPDPAAAFVALDGMPGSDSSHAAVPPRSLAVIQQR
jgi:hypothetical protein